MLITRVSPISGKVHQIQCNVTKEQMGNYKNTGMKIQDAFPDASADEREFILSGITKEEWDNTFKYID